MNKKMKEKHTFWHKNLKTEEAGQGIKWKSKRKVWAQKNDDSTLGGVDERDKRSISIYNMRL